MFKNFSSTKKIDFESMNLWNEWMKKKIDCAFLNRSQNSKRRRKCFCVNFQLCRKIRKMSFVCQKKNDSVIVRFWLQICETLFFYTAYKRKNQKIRSVNFDESNDFMSDESDNWKKKILKNEKKRYSFDFVNKYREYLILRFFEMKRDERLWNNRLSRIRIGEELFVQKKKLLTEMLYRRKICLT